MFKNRKERENLLAKVMNEPQLIPRRVPDYMRKEGGIWYWTGALIMIAFMYEVLTGLLLLFFYQSANPFASSEDLVNSVPFGSVLLSTHLYGAYVMIALVYLHLLRNYFVGAYKKPREMQWLTGVLLLVLTIGAAFFGYAMIGDVLAKAATSIGSTIAGGFPYLGNVLISIFFGNGTSISLYSRLFSWHIVMVLLIGTLFAVHFFLAEYNTIMPARKEAHYRAPAVDTEKPDYKPWYPHNLIFMTELFFFVIGAIILIPSILGIMNDVPIVFSPFPAPANIVANTPPWFLLFVYKELDFHFASDLLNPFWATIIFTGMPLLYLLAIPFLDKSVTLRISDRWFVVALGVLGIVYLVGLSTWAYVYGVVFPTSLVPDYQAAMFFFLPGVAVILFTYWAKISDRTNRLHLERPELFFLVLTFLGLFSVITGILAYESIVAYSNFGAATLAASVTITLVLAVVSVAIVLGIFNPGREKTAKPAGHKARVAFASLFGISAVFIATEVSFINPVGAVNGSYYGIGLALVLFIMAGITKLYRAEVLGE